MSAETEKMDGGLGERAEQVLHQGTGPVLFRRIAPGDWDRVHLFPGPPSAEVIEGECDISLDVIESYAVYQCPFTGGDRERCGYAATGSGSRGRPAWARVMASRMVRPWLRVDVRYELIKHHRSRVWSVCQYPETA